MIASVNLQWTGDMSFEGNVDGFKIPIDASIDFGGNGSAPTPKKFILLALGGCTAMDVISLLKKMRVELTFFNVDVEAVQTEDEHPHIYERFKVIYTFKGNNLENDSDKIMKAISLSQNKYCGVMAMLKNIGPIDFEVKIL